MTDSVRVFRATERSQRPTAQTPGMHREELVATPQSWAGMVTVNAGTVSGWHHHGEYESVIYIVSGKARFEYGAGGSESCEARPGDVVYIPQRVVHRELNVGDEEALALVVRAGEGEPVINVDGPAG